MSKDLLNLIQAYHLKDLLNVLNIKSTYYQSKCVKYNLYVLKKKIYSLRLTIIVFLSIFFLKIIVTLEYQCNIYYSFSIITSLFIEFHPT